MAERRPSRRRRPGGSVPPSVGRVSAAAEEPAAVGPRPGGADAGRGLEGDPRDGAGPRAADPRSGSRPFDPRDRPLGMTRDTWEPSVLTYLGAVAAIGGAALLALGLVALGLILLAGVLVLYLAERSTG